MPIRRAAGTPPQETAPSAAPEGEPDASSEESASVEEEQEGGAQTTATKEGEEQAEEEGAEGEDELKENGEKAEEGEKSDESGETKKTDAAETEQRDMSLLPSIILVRCSAKDGVKVKVKKPAKRTIPGWATMSASKRATVAKSAAFGQPKLDTLLIEAIESCTEKSGASTHSVMKYIVKKYPGLELDTRKFLLKKAFKRQVQKGAIKQLKGKGFAGSFAIGKQPPKPTGKPTVTPMFKAETLGDTLPLIITRLCEPKEASYILIRKYVEQHFPHLNVENRPEILKSALVRAVDKGQLEQITGKGASGTFQLKRSENKFLLKGGPLEDAIMTAIIAMNEPKTCGITTLRKYLVESNKDTMESRVVNNLKRTLQKCKKMGWMEQITGNGLNGTYQLCYPYHPSPAILFPEKHKEREDKLARRAKRKIVESEDEESEEEEEEEDDDDEEEEEESEEEESEEDEPPPPKRKAQRPPPKARRPPPSKKSRPARAKGKRPAPTKRSLPPAKKPVTPAKKPVTPAKKPVTPAKETATPAKEPATPAKKPSAASKAAASKKAAPAKATPVKKAAPATKPKTPVVKKLASKASARPSAQKKTPEKPAAKPAVKAKPEARRSLRAKK